MKKLMTLLALTGAILFSVHGLTASAKTPKKAASRCPYICAADYVVTDGSADVADGLQRMIDENPNRTLYIPDGTYILSHPICTPANPVKSVHLVLGNYAIIRASADWKDEEALIRLGGKDPYNSIYIVGSNYGIEGGIIDGSGVARGISIDSGRETRITRVSIKNTTVGIHIKFGANSGSSDSDISDVNIVGNNTVSSIGVLVEGYDNTFINMRIASVHTGMEVRSGGNNFRNIHPLYIFGPNQEYETSVGFHLLKDSNNFMDYCYSDQFATGFLLSGDAHVNLTDCYAWWYSGKVPFQTAIRCEGRLGANVYGMHVGLCEDCPDVNVLIAEEGGSGTMRNTMIVRSDKLSPKDVSASYTR